MFGFFLKASFFSLRGVYQIACALSSQALRFCYDSDFSATKKRKIHKFQFFANYVFFAAIELFFMACCCFVGIKVTTFGLRF